jgi:uncharacterized protein YkwD
MTEPLVAIWRRRTLMCKTAALTAFTVALLVPAAVLTPIASAQPGGGCAHAYSTVFNASGRQLRRAVVCLINDQRTERGLPRLKVNARLNRSAQDWTNVMVDDGTFTHGTDFAGRISAVGYDWSTAGENIATGFATPASVVNAWMGDVGHCRNVLTPTFAAVGTGVSRLGVRGYGNLGTWTQDFGLWMGRRPPSGNWGPADGCPY